MKKYFYIAAVSFALVACDNDNNFMDQPVALEITASIGNSVNTRASDIKWDNGDKIGITMPGRYINIEYTTESGDGIFKGTSIYFQNKEAVETLVAYYPFYGIQETDPGIIEAITTSDKQTREEQAKYDFLYAKKENVKGSSPSVNLDFSHKMSKLTFVFKNGNSGTDVSKITSYSIDGLVLEGNFDSSTGVCTPKNIESQQLVIDLKDTSVISEKSVPSLIVFPQIPSENSLKMKIHDSENQDYVCELKFDDKGLEPGNNYLFTITVKKTILSVDSSIVNWNTEESESEAKSDDSED